MSIHNILNAETLALRAGRYLFSYEATHYKHMEALMLKGWVFYLVDQVRGRCYCRAKVITIPLWVIQYAIERMKPGRAAQYILHECAHAFVLEKHGLAKARSINHGKEFMEELIAICPPELLIYEMTYKPKNLVKAGAVFCPDSLDF